MMEIKKYIRKLKNLRIRRDRYEESVKYWESIEFKEYRGKP